MSFLNRVHEAARQKIIYTLHALDEMNSESELITVEDVRSVIFAGEIIEEYPQDKRGESCLMYGTTGNARPVHVVCAPKEDYLAIITTYLPSSDKWEADLKTRKSP